MNHWMGAVSLVGILSTAVVWGTDIFFLTIGRPALRLATISAATEVMGFLHMFADAQCRSGGSRQFCPTYYWPCSAGPGSAGSMPYRSSCSSCS